MFLSLEYVPSHLELAHGIMKMPFMHSQEISRKIGIESSALPSLKPAPRGFLDDDDETDSW